MARAAKAVGERRVTIRPAPDTMAYLTALLPVAQAVAAHAALTAAADAARTRRGPDRGRHHPCAGPRLRHRPRVLGPRPSGLHDFRRANPRRVPGASVAATALHPSGDRHPRRDGLHPPNVRGRTAALPADSRRRHLPPPMVRRPVRHLDHIHEHARGGPSTDTNGQGLCLRCNHTKKLPGFTAETIPTQEPGAPHTVRTTTPTGHTCMSQAPPLLPGQQRRAVSAEATTSRASTSRARSA
jgi:hypothetical protein